jgi:hypothetical protein
MQMQSQAHFYAQTLRAASVPCDTRARLSLARQGVQLVQHLRAGIANHEALDFVETGQTEVPLDGDEREPI